VVVEKVQLLQCHQKAYFGRKIGQCVPRQVKELQVP
jgi:hypothetical protein